MRKRQVVVRRSGEESASRNSASASSITIRYGECEKNHAANVGGYAVDGCREFMASNGEEGSIAALTCAACGCHRNFHRREFEAHDLVCDCSSPNSSSNN